MKKTVKWIIIALLLVGIIVGASLLYNTLSDNYVADDPPLPSNSNISDNSDNDKDESNKDFSAPDFTVLDSEGNEVRLSSFKGKPIVLNFWATWCYYCKEEMPDFNRAYQKYPDVQFVMVNATDGVQETVDSAREYVENNGFDFDIFFDEKLEALDSYYVRGLPATFFIDKNGNLVTYRNGMIDSETLEECIEMIRK